MNLYEEKMPAYLAMSRGDLIAEILAHGDKVSEHLSSRKKVVGEANPIQELFGGGEEWDDLPDDIDRSGKIVGIANDVLRRRFGCTIEFTYGQD